ncbi:hypothetical protein VHUM_03080 [Vanrija humicola]|uniref:Major facilitator superfamily (MFS) profile domain-containing protein n=1 Tax=Vanrija humicola TaxID=5417 RepID=A0A7D8YXP2_VANHU|nr:hypothetical protein VHUM_03080 [Vanrija humicola]
MTALIAVSSYSAPPVPRWYQDRFHTGDTGSKVGGIFGTFNAGCMIGGPCNSYVMDKWGRRWAQVTGAVAIVVGAILTTTSHGLAQLIVGRFVLGFGSAFAQSAPAYAMEVARPQWRGRCAAIYNCGWYAGAIPAAAITFGTSYIKSHLSWQLPLIFQCVTSVLICVLIPFVPESPRYLMAVGREDEAEAFLVRYHGGGDPHSPIVQLQIDEMKQSFALQKMERWWDYRTLFKDHAARWRMVQVIMMGIFGQFSGNGLAYYITVIFKQIGVTTVPAQLGYNILYSCMCAIGALTGALLTDTMPRRRVLVIGPAVMSALLAIFVGLNSMINKQVGPDGTGHLDPPLARGALAIYILFGIFISFVYTPLQSVLPVEALSTQMRGKGLAVYTFTMMSMGLINMFAGAQGLGKIGYKYIIIFVVFDAFESVAWYFFGVESCGRTLEELDEIYHQAYPPGASKHFD